jgi:hypothetical protein
VIEDVEREVRVRTDLEIGAAPLVADADRQLVVRRPPEERDVDTVVVPVREFPTGALDEVEVRHIGSSCGLEAGLWTMAVDPLCVFAGSGRM